MIESLIYQKRQSFMDWLGTDAVSFLGNPIVVLHQHGSFSLFLLFNTD